MTRAERAAEAARLRGEGLNGVEIAAAMGLSRSYVSVLLKDPDGSRDRARKRAYGGRCVDCGGSARELWPLIERRWREGATAREIAVECGASEGDIGTMVHAMRRAGVDVPRRLPARSAA